MFSSPYFPHALFSLACLSISINLVGARRTSDDERARLKAQISILESIKTQLQSAKPLSTDELQRLKKLARPSAKDTAMGSGLVGEEVSWSDIFKGKKPAGKDGEVESKWDKEDLEKMRKELLK